MKVVRFVYLKFFAALSFITVLSACTTQLVPGYDKALFDGITQTNIQIMELFASVSFGTDASTFSEREAAYNAIIGRVDALALQSKARPVPDNKITEKVNKFLESRGISALSDGEAPSAASLEEASENLVKMRDKDKSDGLRSGAISAFKNAVVISMDQALTYEAFLER
jgi:hypothetical protein